MGYLTTLTIYNDGLDQIKKNPEQFVEGLLNAARAIPAESSVLPVGSFGNLVKVQKTRHADDCTVYVHMGNTVCEMNAYSEETLKTMMQATNFFKKMLAEMKNQVKMLSKQLKEYEEDQKMLDEMTRQCRMLKKQLKEYKEEKNATNSNR